MSLDQRPTPTVSIVVVIFDMEREAPRTFESLCPTYQGIDESLYEVVVVDNGSREPLGAQRVASYGTNFRYLVHQPPRPSPAAAVNFGVRRARADIVAVMIDGARLLSPGLLRHALRAFRAFDLPLVATLGWHIGPDVQWKSTQAGYDRTAEDGLLRHIGWPTDGYRLFEISALAGSSRDGWFLPIAESNCLFMHRRVFERLRGLDERFNLPGGGLVNLDFYKRACELPDTELVVLLGEGTFHQLHAGVTTSASQRRHAEIWREFESQYRVLRGGPYRYPQKPPVFFGTIPPHALESIRQSADHALQRTHPRSNS